MLRFFLLQIHSINTSVSSLIDIFLLHSVWIQYEKRRYVRKDSIVFWYISNDVFEEVQYHPTSVSKRFVNFDGKVCEWNIIHDIFQNALFVDITKEMRCAFVQTVQYVYITFLTLVITKRIRVPYITAFTQIGCKSKVQGHATSHCRWLHIRNMRDIILSAALIIITEVAQKEGLITQIFWEYTQISTAI